MKIGSQYNLTGMRTQKPGVLLRGLIQPLVTIVQTPNTTPRRPPNGDTASEEPLSKISINSKNLLCVQI